ncbi:MAG: HepT-like ribonuclease domain-containing protein [Bacteroidota bacterium]
MTDRAKKYLVDILHSISLIEDFLIGTEGFELYRQDLKTKSAVERQLGIIGEAVNQFQKEESSVQFSSARQIISFRNRIIHAYDSIDDSIVWVILRKHIPILKQEAAEALN